MLGGFDSKEWLLHDNPDVIKLFEAWDDCDEEQAHYQFGIHKTKASLDEAFEAWSKNNDKLTVKQMVEWSDEKDVDIISCAVISHKGLGSFMSYQAIKDPNKVSGTNHLTSHNLELRSIAYLEGNIPVTLELCSIAYLEKNIQATE